jgi:hypothetical protein
VNTPLNLWLPDDHTFASASSFIATIDSDIASIPDDQFGKVFAGGIGIMFGSVLSTIFVGFLIESGGGGYADLVAETYAEQNMGEQEESYLNSLGLVSWPSTVFLFHTEDVSKFVTLRWVLSYRSSQNAGQKAETEEMVRSFREKKMKKAGTWTAADEEQKQQLVEEKRMFDDYD